MSSNEKGSSLDAGPREEAPVFWRALIAVLLCLCHIVSYADRFNISVAILHMASEYGYSFEEQGHIFAAFFYGYITTQLIAGAWASPASVVGPKRCLVFACVAWSLVTIVTPLCADHSFTMLICARVALGAAEGLYIPACIALIASWFPVHERASVVAFGHVGQCLGAVAAMACAPLAAYNWRLLFYIFGAIGLVWAAVFCVLGSDGPGVAQALLDPESHDDYGAATATTAQKDVSYFAILSSPAFWAIATAHIAYNWSWYLTLSWLPRYFVQVHSVTMEDVGQFAMWPYIAAAAACIIWARVVDTCLVQCKLPLWHARVLSQCVSAVGPISAWTVLIFADVSVLWAVVLLAVAVAVQTAGQSSYPPNMVDIGGTWAAGRIAGASNTLATLPGMIGNVLVGALLGKMGGGWPAVFGTMIAAQVIGLVVFTSFARVELQF